MDDIDAVTEATDVADRTFRVRGVELCAKETLPVRPFFRYADWEREIGQENIGAFPAESFEVLNGFIRSSLEPESRARWDALLDDEDASKPISFDDMIKIINRLNRVVTDRDPTQRSHSATGGENGATRSTDASDSPAASDSADLISGRF